MKKLNKLLVLVAVFIFCILPAKNVYADVTKITMLSGETRQFPNAFWYCKYETSDERIATVNEAGVIEAKMPGEVTVKQHTLQGPVEYQVTVTNVPVDIVICMGQSNMCGSGGRAMESSDIKDGVYQYGRDQLFHMEKQGNLLPAFGNAFVKQTKRPVIMIQTAVGGSGTRAWIEDGLLKNSNTQLQKCRKMLAKNNIPVKNVYCLWYQGETDAKKAMDKQTYMKNVKKIFRSMKRAGAKKFLIIQIGEYRNRAYDISTIVNAQNTLAKKNKKEFVLVTNITAKLSADISNYTDNVHFNQNALNKIGESAGKKAGKLARK